MNHETTYTETTQFTQFTSEGNSVDCVNCVAQVSTVARKHFCPYHPAIIEALAELIPAHVPIGHTIHDPFAGEGVRLGALCDRLGYTFTGTDLIPWLARDIRISRADATLPTSYPATPFAVVTSPTFNNGCNDSFISKDGTRRNTYTWAAGNQLLDATNTGRWSGRNSKRAEAKYWRLHRLALPHWPDVAIIDLKDSYRTRRKGVEPEYYPLVDLWKVMLDELGYCIVGEQSVPTPGIGYGANRGVRVPNDNLLVARRKGTT